MLYVRKFYVFAFLEAKKQRSGFVHLPLQQAEVSFEGQ
jgi:hypothetical protein